MLLSHVLFVYSCAFWVCALFPCKRLRADTILQWLGLMSCLWCWKVRNISRAWVPLSRFSPWMVGVLHRPFARRFGRVPETRALLPWVCWWFAMEFSWHLIMHPSSVPLHIHAPWHFGRSSLTVFIKLAVEQTANSVTQMWLGDAAPSSNTAQLSSWVKDHRSCKDLAARTDGLTEFFFSLRRGCYFKIMKFSSWWFPAA